jgi:hypothetical protein
MHLRGTVRRRARHSILLVGVLAADFASGGCSGGKELSSTLDDSVSAVATLQMALESWLANRVPSAFTARVVDEERSQLQKAGERLEKFGDTAPETRSLAMQTLHSAASLAGVADAVEQRNAAVVQVQLRELIALTAALRAARARAIDGK